MGGKRKSKQKVPYYYMSIHYGICHGPIDSLNQIWIKDKVVLCSEVKEPVVVYLNQPELFGGETKEGGIAGAVECYFGTHDQVMTQPSAARFGRTSANMVAYRGVASLFFRGLSDAERHDLPAGVAAVGTTYPHAFLGVIAGIASWVNGVATTASGYAGFFARTLASATHLFDPLLTWLPTGGGFWWITNNPYLPSAWAHVTRLSRPFSPVGDEWVAIQPPVGPEAERLGDFPAGGGGTAYEGVDVTPYAEGIDAGLATMHMTFSASATTDTGSPGDGFDSLLQQCHIVFADVNGDTLDYEYEQEFIDGGGTVTLTRDVPVGTRTIFMKGEGYLTFPVFADWAPGETLWRLDYGANGALLCPGSGASGSPFDSNPSYMIADCLTNRQWGMGHPLSSLDQASFLAAAETLYNEHFGLSMLWSEQATIEKFVSEILDHIQGTLFIDPSTGLWTLKLIRFDYNPATLRTLNKNNSKVTNRQRKAEGEIINEIVVSYKDFQTEENKTVTFHDLAGVAQLGEIVSDTRNYYGIRSDYLANFVGARDIRTASYALFSCDVEANRTFYNVRPGDVVKLDLEEDGIVGMVIRVGKVDYGQPGDSKIRFTATEDIFALEATEYSSTQPSLWENPDVAPEPLERERVVEIPLPLLYRSGFAEADLTDDRYPEVVTGVFGDDPAQDISLITIWGDYVSPSGEESQRTIGSVVPTPSMVLATALVPEVESTLPGSRLRVLLSGQDPESGDFLYLDGPNETGEIIMLDVYDANTDIWTVARGIFDTVPRAWPIGHIVWHWGSSLASFDPTMNIDGVATVFKLLPTNSRGTLLDFQAETIEHVPSARPYMPFRPADCQIDGNGFDESHYSPLLGGVPDDVELTWVNRNRLQEDGLATRWTEATVTPEDGQTTTIRVRERFTQSVEMEVTGITGTSHTLGITGLVDFRFYDVEFIAVRDGFESLQWATRLMDIERLGYGANYDYDYSENDGG